MDEKIFHTLGCVIMASGLGTRFGGNKLMSRIQEQCMLQYTIDYTSQLQNRVVVTRHKDVEDYCKEQGIPVLFHELPNRNDTIRLGLTYLIHEAREDSQLEGCFFCQGDQPFFRKESLKEMCEHFKRNPEKIYRPAFENMVGAPVLFPKWSFDELLCLKEKEGGQVVVKKHPEAVALVAVSSPMELKDIDTKQDLEAIDVYLKKV